MKLHLQILVVFFALANIGCGAVGDGGVSDGSSYLLSGQGTLAGLAAQGAGLSGALADQTAAALPYESSSGSRGYIPASYSDPSLQGQQLSQGSQAYASSAPQTSSPYQERMSAEDLKLSLPTAESFKPDANLDFVPASLPSEMRMQTYGSSQSAVPGSTGADFWYYPGFARSSNKFYVQTVSGLGTVAGCRYGGYLPLWSDIRSGGNFYVYEWYPGQNTPRMRWWGWTWTGFKKGWFSGDAAGWHILCYYCQDWSNYVYVYVYPGTGTVPEASYREPSDATMEPYLPSGAPTPPNPNAESLALPDFNQYRPASGEGLLGSRASYPAQTGYPAQAGYPSQTGYPTQTSYLPQTGNPSPTGYPASASGEGYLASSAYFPQTSLSGQTGYAGHSCATCSGSSPASSGVSGSYPFQSACPTCTGSSGIAAPQGYSPQSYQAVYPRPSTCRCNEYYVQYVPGKLCTVAGMYRGEWLPLWSKISMPGVYWSSEWTICTGISEYYCSPEVRNFGYKSTGWYQTWFRGDKPGWHILCYYCNDWSNYIYIYVWPAD